MKDKNPLSPHIQIYSWHISSLVSISHRITGIINVVILTLVCFWISLLLFGNTNYDLIHKFFETFLGKFLIVGTVWSFSFQALSEIRHLFWDLGYGFSGNAPFIWSLIVLSATALMTVITVLLYLL